MKTVKPDDAAATEELTPFERFKAATAKILASPKPLPKRPKKAKPA